MKAKKEGLVLYARHYAMDSFVSLFTNKASTGYAGKLHHKEAHRAGCPRFKPGQVAKVRVTIEEVRP